MPCITESSGFHHYAMSYKLIIDAMVARDIYDRIVIVSAHADLLLLTFSIHQAGKKIDFVLPEGCMDTNFFKFADNVLDFKMQDYVMEVY